MLSEVTRTRLKILALLIGVVLLAHIIAIRLLVVGSRSEAKPTQNPAEEHGIPEPELVRPGTSPAALPSGKSKPAALPGTPAKNTRIAKKPMSARRALDWSGAVYGDIKTLPEPGKVKVGILVDLNTRKVLWAKNPKQSVPVASMTKMMTLLLTFEELERNPAISLDSMIPVSKTAAAIREGVIHLDVRETFALRDLLMAVTIKSANDAAQLVAEFIGGGSSERFVERMNARAFELGMPGTRFTNPHGLPNPEKGDSLSSAEGMLYLAEAVMQYPQIMEWAGTKQTFIRDGKTELTTTNKLILPHYPGVDGLKTGYTRHAGSCLTFSCLRDGRRIVGVVAGVQGSRVRDKFCRRLLDWAYAAKK